MVKNESRSHRMVALYAFTIFISAALLLLAQTVYARMVLPLLGDSPGVWSTAVVFYQIMLLAGYAYAHGTTRLMGARRQAALHLAIIVMPFAVLPFAIPPGWVPPVETNPIPWIFGLMTLAVGLPFFAISSTTALLQQWFSDTTEQRASDPYFLFVASNVGSILALLSYPVLFEPYLRITQQTQIWMWGYLGFVLLMIGCAILLWQSPPRIIPVAEPTPGWSRPPVVLPLPPPPMRQKLRWLLLALVPASLLLGVTNYLSSELAVIPAMWVVPLALYLLSFVFAFARRKYVPRMLMNRALPLLLAPVVMLFAMRATQPIGMVIGVHLAVFFVAAFLCHSQLADERPPAELVTGFYLWISIGSVLGGAFNAVLAPLLFNSSAEYPLMLGVVCLVGMRGTGNKRLGRPELVDLLWPSIVVIFTLALTWALQSVGAERRAMLMGMGFSVASLACFFLSKHPIRFVLASAGVLLVSSIYEGETGQQLYAERSFFGVHRVTLDPTGEYHMLIHGRTLHGMQSLDTQDRAEALSYYHRTGPIGEVLSLYAQSSAKRIGAVGLGAGSLAAYAKPGQEWTYFELDPIAAKLAKDQRFFTYLYDAQADVDLVLGDARLSIADEEDAHFDLLVLDAYSSDAIPVHWATREAVQLYLKKLAPGGILAFHISNQHLDLEPVFANLARDAKLVTYTRDDTLVSPELYGAGKSPSVWLVMARKSADLSKLTRDARWQPSRGSKSAVWTDDYSNLLAAFRWK